MAHMIDMTAGRAGMAYIGDTPWHGLGQQMKADEPLEAWRERAGLGWEAKMTPALYSTGTDEGDGIVEVPESMVLYRSDTKAALGTVSPRYRIVQPVDIVEFYRDLTERHGFRMETLGAIRDGRVVWALARTGDAMTIGGIDRVDGYLLLSTSFDGSMATTGRFTTVRVVCNNTLSAAHRGAAAGVSIPHSAIFNADAAKVKLGVGDAFKVFNEQAEGMAAKSVTPRQAIEFFLEVYHSMKAAEIVTAQSERTTDKTIQRLSQHFIAGPGAELATAKNTVWGLLNAVTRDVDFNERSRSKDGRLMSAWYGAGNATKEKARSLALELAGIAEAA